MSVDAGVYVEHFRVREFTIKDALVHTYSYLNTHVFAWKHYGRREHVGERKAARCPGQSMIADIRKPLNHYIVVVWSLTQGSASEHGEGYSAVAPPPHLLKHRYPKF